MVFNKNVVLYQFMLFLGLGAFSQMVAGPKKKAQSSKQAGSKMGRAEQT